MRVFSTLCIGAFLIIFSTASLAADESIIKHNDKNESQETGYPSDDDMEKVIKSLEVKRELNNKSKKKLLDEKEYKKYAHTEKEANKAWLKYVDKECYSQIIGYAEVNSSAFNYSMDDCMFQKYKARLNDTFLESK